MRVRVADASVGTGDLDQRRQRAFERRHVAPHDLGPTPAPGVFQRLTQLLHRLVHRHHLGQREEAQLHHRVDAAAEPGALGLRVAVDREQPAAAGDQLLLGFARQAGPDPVGRHGGVQQHGRARCGAGQHVPAVQELGRVHRHELRLADAVGGADRPGPEAQVRHRGRTRLARVVLEVALDVDLALSPGLLADDPDRGLVGRDGAVRAEPEKHRSRLVGGLEFAVEGWVERQRAMRHVVADAHGEAGGRLGLREGVEHRLHHRRRELLARQAVAPANHARHAQKPTATHGRKQAAHHLLQQRLAAGPRLLGAIEHGDGPDAGGQRLQQVLDRERPEQAHLDHADPLAAGRQELGRLVRALRARAHHHDDAFGLRVAAVVEQPIAAAGQRGEPGQRVVQQAGVRPRRTARRPRGSGRKCRGFCEVPRITGALRGPGNGRGGPGWRPPAVAHARCRRPAWRPG